ncbi:MAG: hypothetical protein ACOVQA_13045 [Thermoflexibacteraceae bacterium]
MYDWSRLNGMNIVCDIRLKGADFYGDFQRFMKKKSPHRVTFLS